MSATPRASSRLLQPAATAAILALLAATAFGNAAPAVAAQSTIELGTADSFAVLAGQTVTNTNTSTVTGDVGVSPGSTTPGLTPAMVNGGSIHAADATAASAQGALTTAYNSAAGRQPRTAVATELGGRTLSAGVYKNPTLAVTGTLTLDAKGDPASVFVFQATSTLITATSSRVRLTNGADACRVFWQVGSSATLGTTSVFAGSILAQASVSVGQGASIRGRLLARTGSVTLIGDTITRPGCAPVAPPSSTSPSGSSASPTAPATGTTGGTATASPTGPTAGDISPSSGPETGGTTVRISGTGFTSRSTVIIGGDTVAAGDVDVTSSRSLTFVTPARSAGTAKVVVATKRGSTSPTGLTFTYRSTNTLAATGSNDLALAGGGSGLLVLGLLVLQFARRPVRGRHAR